MSESETPGFCDNTWIPLTYEAVSLCISLFKEVLLKISSKQSQNLKYQVVLRFRQMVKKMLSIKCPFKFE